MPLLSFSAGNFGAVGSKRVFSVFGADMHPEKDAATLNKCKSQQSKEPKERML
jgi:hypothetical protein